MEDTYASCDIYSKLKSMTYLSDSVFLMTRQICLLVEMKEQMFESMTGLSIFSQGTFTYMRVLLSTFQILLFF